MILKEFTTLNFCSSCLKTSFIYFFTYLIFFCINWMHLKCLGSWRCFLFLLKLISRHFIHWIAIKNKFFLHYLFYFVLFTHTTIDLYVNFVPRNFIDFFDFNNVSDLLFFRYHQHYLQTMVVLIFSFPVFPLFSPLVHYIKYYI